MKSHPKGLYVLFFTELWERFSYYGMRAILVLYIISTASEGGLGWQKQDALFLYGIYTMAVYVMSIPGGIIADRFLGQKKTVMLGGGLLVLGHTILAIDTLWAFYTGLVLIVLGVGGLKPNISTMVGGLYPQGDPRRDKGFTIFYIGINIGAFIASIIVGLVGEKVGWHYGFGLAGIGMLIGQIVFIYGQKHLKGVGDFVPSVKIEGTNKNKPLTRVEKDRVFVLLVSFLIVMVFWGAFEQAGGLMNIYAKEKINRLLFGWEVPASVFQSLNPMFIMIFGTAVAGFWINWFMKKKESSAIFKMAVGTMIMGLGFLVMSFASVEASSADFGKAGMYWLVFAYLLHTIGELCSSPVALSFITKLAPAKYASIMMGLYFATTGFGNLTAGMIGEATQPEPIITEIRDYRLLEDIVGDTTLSKKQDFKVRSNIDFDNGEVNFKVYKEDTDLDSVFAIKNIELLKEVLHEFDGKKEFLGTYIFVFDKDDTQKYKGELHVEEWSNKKEFRTFTFIFVFTLLFGAILLLFLKPLKRLTHGAEDVNLDS